ncbi:MAG: hypothetical protein MKZ98_08770 [Pseudomonadales bacterium]|nr:hypothetical protein [Pseudomonadales bacterium]
MVKVIVGIVATAIVLNIFGFIFWGAATVPYQSLQTVPDSGAAQSALATHFPEVGTYLIPGSPAETENAEVVAKQYESGPVAMIHITSQGRPLMDPSIMVSCFILNVLIVAALATLFRVAGAAEFRDFARLSLVAAVLAVVLVDGGDMIWWQEPVSWALWPAIYNLLAIILAGHILGLFMKANSVSTSGD